MSREELEQIALENCDAADFYDLQDCIEIESDETLMSIADAPNSLINIA